jgi:hypothetical protein
MKRLSIPDREAKTRRQLALVDTALTKAPSLTRR